MQKSLFSVGQPLTKNWEGVECIAGVPADNEGLMLAVMKFQPSSSRCKWRSHMETGTPLHSDGSLCLCQE